MTVRKAKKLYREIVLTNLIFKGEHNMTLEQRNESYAKLEELKKEDLELWKKAKQPHKPDTYMIPKGTLLIVKEEIKSQNGKFVFGVGEVFEADFCWMRAFKPFSKFYANKQSDGKPWEFENCHKNFDFVPELSDDWLE